MKLTVIMDANGELVGTVHGYASEHEAAAQAEEAGGAAWVVPGPGQTFHELEVPDELEGIEDAEELHTRVRNHL